MQYEEAFNKKYIETDTKMQCKNIKRERNSILRTCAKASCPSCLRKRIQRDWRPSRRSWPTAFCDWRHTAIRWQWHLRFIGTNCITASTVMCTELQANGHAGKRTLLERSYDDNSLISICICAKKRRKLAKGNASRYTRVYSPKLQVRLRFVALYCRQATERMRSFIAITRCVRPSSLQQSSFIHDNRSLAEFVVLHSCMCGFVALTLNWNWVTGAMYENFVRSFSPTPLYTCVFWFLIFHPNTIYCVSGLNFECRWCYWCPELKWGQSSACDLDLLKVNYIVL